MRLSLTEAARLCPLGWYSSCKLQMLEDSPHIDISGGASMNWSVIRHLAIAALVAYPASALGQEQAPDVKGKWIRKTHTILVGKGGHWPKGRGTWANPALLEKDLAFDIRGQDGRRFWGVTTLSGGGEKTDEPFIGLLPAARERRHAPEAAAVLSPDVEREVLLEQGRVVPGSTAFRPMPALAHKYSVSFSDLFALDVGRLVLPERKSRICNQRDDHEVANDRPIHRPSPHVQT